MNSERTHTIAGLTTVACIALVAFGFAVNPFDDEGAELLSVAITTPFVGQGIEPGAPIVLNGVEVGEVVSVSSTTGGDVRLVADLQPVPVRGLTDAMVFDYRPVNYFGVAGINIVPRPGGQVMRDGSEITATATGNFTLSQLLSQLGDVSQASLTPQLVEVVDRVTRYTDGLNPLIETAITVTRTIERVQTVSTERLLSNTTSIAASLPVFADSAIEASRRFTDFSYYPGQSFPSGEAMQPRTEFPYLEGLPVPNLADVSEEYFQKSNVGFARTASDGLFAAIGKLERSHVDDLVPLIAGIKALTDATPPLLRPQDIAAKLAELRSRFERLYAGNGEHRAMNVRVVLDSLPAVAAPLGIVTQAQPPVAPPPAPIPPAPPVASPDPITGGQP